MKLHHLLSQLRQIIKVLKNSIIDGADKIENVCSINVTSPDKKGDNCLHPACMNLYHLLGQKRQFIKAIQNSTIYGAKKIENVCSTDIVIRNMLSFLKGSSGF